VTGGPDGCVTPLAGLAIVSASDRSYSGPPQLTPVHHASSARVNLAPAIIFADPTRPEPRQQCGRREFISLGPRGYRVVDAVVVSRPEERRETPTIFSPLFRHKTHRRRNQYWLIARQSTYIIFSMAGLGSRVDSASDCGVRGPGFESRRAGVVFHAPAAAICSIVHGSRTFTALPLSTQLSSLRGTVK